MSGMIDVTILLFNASLPSTALTPLEIFASAGTLLVYAISVVGLLRLRKLGVQGDSEPFRAPGGVLLPAICTIIIAGLLWSLGWQQQVAAFGLAIVGAIPGYLTTRKT